MSGKLMIEGKGGGRRTALLVALSAAAALGLCLALLPLLAEGSGLGGVRGGLLALTAYAGFRVFYGWLGKAGAPAGRTVSWELTADALILDGRSIPRASLRQVHCWPNRDALGHSLPGRTVNIETSGGNLLLRSAAEAPEESERQLRALVEALGYGDRWTGKE